MCVLEPILIQEKQQFRSGWSKQLIVPIEGGRNSERYLVMVCHLPCLTLGMIEDDETGRPVADGGLARGDHAGGGFFCGVEPLTRMS